MADTYDQPTLTPEQQLSGKVLDEFNADPVDFRTTLKVATAADDTAVAPFGTVTLFDAADSEAVGQMYQGDGNTGTGDGNAGADDGNAGSDDGNAGSDQKGEPKDGKLDKGPAKKPEEVLADEHGLTVQAVTVDGRREYVYYTTDSDGKQIVVASGNDVQEIEKKIAEYEHKKIEELEKKYNVDILEDGEKGRKGVEARTPTAGELAAIEQALKTSQPSQLTADGRPLQLVVPKERSSEHAGYYTHGDEDNPPQIIVEPDMFERYGKEKYTEIWSHELAHTGQDSFINQDEDRAAAYGEKFGFTRTDDGRWLMQTSDQPPQYFEHQQKKDEDGNVIGEYWARTDSKGGFIDADGNPVKDATEAESLTKEEMRERAKVPPISNYFPSPIEMGAEAMAHFRRSPEARADMLRTNPELYEVAKKQDQSEINARYGYTFSFTEGFRPAKIRNERGEIVDNTKSARTGVALWEEQQKPVPPVKGHGSGEDNHRPGPGGFVGGNAESGNHQENDAQIQQSQDRKRDEEKNREQMIRELKQQDFRFE